MPTRGVAALTVLALSAATLLAVPGAAHAAPKPPPNPTNGQLSAAAAAKAAANAEVSRRSAAVGRLGGQVAAAQSELAALQGTAELAEQKVAYAVSKQRDGETAARTAIAANKTAVAAVTANNNDRVREVQAIYIGGESSDGATGALLQAKNPSQLLSQSTLTDFIVDNKMDAIGRSQRLAVTASNTAAKARLAVQRLKTLTAAAQSAQRAAAAAVSLQAARKSSLEATLASSRTALVAEQNAFSAAQASLVKLTGQRATYVAYQRYQAYLREQRRLAALAAARAKRLAAQRAAAQAAAARARKNHQGGGGGGGGGNTYNPPVDPVGGSWSAARGRAAVARAMTTLGTPYAWAGGGASGPSYGVCDASNGAPNDCYVRGYDCSGLAMYAWGPYLSMPHYAASQYTVAGSYHPPLSKLKPGDLLFWSNGGISGIHHVAIYIGSGQIVQAPYSGGNVEISSMYDPGTIFGATRPLT
ncbi:C40 family peptidase [uncultured Jatrophihabitans sp.]|uniref:C40 family peptidase n=1 Tax=uncultured Jatrophihabitans sp. TaxID=1610747 RepID=UPI0035CB891D